MFIRLLLFFTTTFIGIHCYSQNTYSKKTNVNPKAIELNNSAVKLATDNLHYDIAIDLLNQALQIDSNFLTALYNKFSYECGLKKYDYAINTAHQILRIEPNNFTTYYLLGMSYLNSGDTLSSQKNFNEAEIQINNILDTLKSANRNYKNLLLNKAVILIYKDSTQASDSILNLLISNTKDRFEKDMYSIYLHKTKAQLMSGALDGTQTSTMDSSESIPTLNMDTVKFCGKKDIRKYKFQPGFYLLREDRRKSKGFIVSDTNQYYFIAKNITIPLSGVDSVYKRFNNRFKRFELIFYFNDASIKALSDFSMICINQKVGLLLNNMLINAANVIGPINSGELSLTGLKQNEREIDNLIQSIRNEINKQEPVKDNMPR